MSDDDEKFDAGLLIIIGFGVAMLFLYFLIIVCIVKILI